MKCVKKFLLSFYLFIFIFFLTINALAQDVNSEEKHRLTSLSSIAESIESTSKELRAKQKELQSDVGKGREDELKSAISKLSEDLKGLELSFNEIASGSDLGLIHSVENNNKIDWSSDLQELLSPLIDEVKRITNKPRENSKLRTKVSDYEKQLNVINSALERIETLINITKDNKLINEQLNITQAWWKGEKTRVSAELQIAQSRLSSNLNERKNLTQSLSEVPDMFFKSRARNLAVALLVAALFWFLLRKFYNYYQNRMYVRPLYIKRQGQRFFAVFYMISAGLGTLIVFMTALTYFEDWVLLTLTILVLFGVLWTSKEIVPRYIEQLILILNLGSVREGERVVLNGLPYRVDKINLMVDLVNPLLAGGQIKLPIRDLSNMRSRRFNQNELWFPTAEGDWVIMNDIYGQVLSQTPDMVQIKMKGGSIKSYLPNEFISLQPINLSKGFRIESVIGIDYSHQKISTNEALNVLKNYIEHEISNIGYSEQLSALSVEFKEAGSSSLDIAIIADFLGAAAKDYPFLKRLLQKLAVDCCIKNNWIIPFPQLTVHGR